MRCDLDKKPHDYYVPANEDYHGEDPWYMLPKRILFWLHMLFLPAVCGWGALVLLENEEPRGYNIFYLVYVIGFSILLLFNAWYDSTFKRERTLHAYQISK